MLMDQYTVKGKAHRKSKDKFIQVILKNKPNLQQALTLLLIENSEERILKIKRKDSKLHGQLSELFSEKLSLLNELFTQLDSEDFILIQELIEKQQLQGPFLELLNSKNSKNRLKGLNLLKLLFEQYILTHNKGANFQQSMAKYTKEDACFTQLMLVCLKKGLENERDSKLQFNALLILDQVFQHLLKAPSLQQEIELNQNKGIKQKQQGQREEAKEQEILKKDIEIGDEGEDLDKEELFANHQTEVDFDSLEYLEFRQREILKLWSIISMLIDSPWSNIRSIAYGIVCYWVKNASGMSESSFRNSLMSTLKNLLLSKESECRTGGLNILGSFCGLGYNFDVLAGDIRENLQFFRRNAGFVPNGIWECVYDMQFDWDSTNQAASITITQLAAPRDVIMSLIKAKSSGLSFEINPSANLHSSETEQGLQEKQMKWRQLSGRTERSFSQKRQIAEMVEEKYVFWMEQLEDQEIKELISMFRNEFKPPQTLWIERVNYNMEESKQDDADHQNSSLVEDTNVRPSYVDSLKSQFGHEKEEEVLDFEDLGIIEVDDEEWNEYDVVEADNSRRKIPNLKQKVNNISPQLQLRDKSPSTKTLRKTKQQQQQQTFSNKAQNLQSQQQSQSQSGQLLSGQATLTQPENTSQQQAGNSYSANSNINKDEELVDENDDEYGSADHSNSNLPYSEVEQYFQIDDGENVRIVDELELMEYLKAHGKDNSGVMNSWAESSTGGRDILSENPQNGRAYSAGGKDTHAQEQYGLAKAARPRAITPPIDIRYEDHQADLVKKGLMQQQQSSQQLMQQSPSQMQLGGGSLKSEEYIYSDSAESDDYQDVFIKQQEFLFRQQRQQKQQKLQNDGKPEGMARPLSAKLNHNQDSYYGCQGFNNGKNYNATNQNNSNQQKNSKQKKAMNCQQESPLRPSSAQTTLKKETNGIHNSNNNQNNNDGTSQMSMGSPPGNNDSNNITNKNAVYALAQKQLQAQQQHSAGQLTKQQSQQALLTDQQQQSQVVAQKSQNNSVIQSPSIQPQGQPQSSLQYLQKQEEELNQKQFKQQQQQQQKQIFDRSKGGQDDENNEGFDNNKNVANLAQVITLNSNTSNQLINNNNTNISNSNFNNIANITPPLSSTVSQQYLKSSSQQQLQSQQGSLTYGQAQIQPSSSNNNNNDGITKERSESGTKSSGRRVEKLKQSLDQISSSMRGGQQTQQSQQQIDKAKNRYPEGNIQAQQEQQLSRELHEKSNSEQYQQSLLNQQDNETKLSSPFYSPDSSQANYSQNNNNSLNQRKKSAGRLAGNMRGVSSLEASEAPSVNNGVTSSSQQYQQQQQLLPSYVMQYQNSHLSGSDASNSMIAAQGSQSYQQLASQSITAVQGISNSVGQQQQQQVFMGVQTNGNSSVNKLPPGQKYISEKVNVNRLVSVPQNYRAPFGNTGSNNSYQNNNSSQGGFNNCTNNAIIITSSGNNNNNNNVNTASTSCNQNNNTYAQTNITSLPSPAMTLKSNSALNSTLSQHHSQPQQQMIQYPTQQQQQQQQYQQNISNNNNNNTSNLQSSRSKEKLLRKLMVKNIDLEDLKSVWKMNSEIRNNAHVVSAGYAHSQTFSSSNHHHHHQAAHSTHSAHQHHSLLHQHGSGGNTGIDIYSVNQDKHSRTLDNNELEGAMMITSAGVNSNQASGTKLHRSSSLGKPTTSSSSSANNNNNNNTAVQNVMNINAATITAGSINANTINTANISNHTHNFGHIFNTFNHLHHPLNTIGFQENLDNNNNNNTNNSHGNSTFQNSLINNYLANSNNNPNNISDLNNNNRSASKSKKKKTKKKHLKHQILSVASQNLNHPNQGNLLSSITAPPSQVHSARAHQPDKRFNNTDRSNSNPENNNNNLLFKSQPQVQVTSSIISTHSNIKQRFTSPDRKSQQVYQQQNYQQQLSSGQQQFQNSTEKLRKDSKKKHSASKTKSPEPRSKIGEDK